MGLKFGLISIGDPVKMPKFISNFPSLLSLVHTILCNLSNKHTDLNCCKDIRDPGYSAFPILEHSADPILFPSLFEMRWRNRRIIDMIRRYVVLDR